MSTHTEHTENFKTYFYTLVCYRWLPLFEITNLYDQIYNWFDHLKTNCCYILGYVIMLNHLHALLYPTQGSLNKLTANGKRFMAYEMVKCLEQLKRYALLKELEQGVQPNERRKGKKHQVFRLSFDARQCFDEKMVEQKLDYLHHNPVQGKWNLAEDHANCQHSSAQFYETGVHGVYEVKHYREIVVEEERWVKGSSESSARDSEEVKSTIFKILRIVQIMINFSNRGQDLTLKSGESFILIDGLYLNSVKRKFDSLKTEDFLNEIRSKIFPFPYTDIPFASFYMSHELFPINKIIKVNYDDIVENEKEKCFSTDTGLLILILPNLIENFIKKYDYEDLVGSPIQPVNLEYWIDITNEISQNEIGLILSPGMHSGFEFEGSGTYKVDL